MLKIITFTFKENAGQEMDENLNVRERNCS